LPQPSPLHVPGWAWIVFAVTVVIMLVVDLSWSKVTSAATRRLTLTWSVLWIASGLGFGVFVAVLLGSRAAQEYFAAYAMEKALSLDNIFLFYVIFDSLGVPLKFQHKVLFWGIFGALVFRALFLAVGVAVLNRWEWVSYLFAAVLLYAAWDAFRKNPAGHHKSRVLSWLSRHMPLQENVETGKFLAFENGRRTATPLLVALVAIELTDVMFALDSMPAALSITRNPFLVYSSNVFAILGLRALYLFLASTITSLPYLHYGLAAVLAFASIKILVEEWVHIPPLVSLGVILTLIAAAVWASLHARRVDVLTS
jgi:tellurite resistance protein TerC